MEKRICFLSALCLLAFGARAGDLSGKLILFHAGSLSVPFEQIASEFNSIHPHVEILREAAGSRACARKISDLHRPCDVMASADYTVIDQLLMPEHADWNIKFAANEMTIAYHPDSRRAKEIGRENWHEILLDDKVIFGRSDPNTDPCGYRAVLTMKLTGLFRNDPSIPKKLLDKDLTYIRPKETDLLGLLESHAIDYIFIYRSVAEQHGLDFLLLPDEVNLRNPAMSATYAKVNVRISGQKPGEFVTKTGAPIVYGITIPRDPPNTEAALAFVEFVLGSRGRAILEKCGQTSLAPSPTASYDNIPELLKKYATQE